MIVLVIISIIASVAVPSYNEQVKRGKRSDGKAFALEIAARQEQVYAQFARYADTLNGDGSCGPDACNLGYTDNLSPDQYYSVDIDYNDAIVNAYSLNLTPVAGRFTDNDCPVLNYRHTGVKGVNGAYHGDSDAADTAIAKCWK